MTTKVPSTTQWDDLISRVSPSKVFYGTCGTAGSTQTKVVGCPKFKSSDLVAGTVLIVKMTNGQTYNGTVKFNVNSTGSKDVYSKADQANGNGIWKAGNAVMFVYNGTRWYLMGDTNIPVLYSEYGTNTDGALTQNFVSTRLQTLEELLGEVHSVLVSVNGE